MPYELSGDGWSYGECCCSYAVVWFGNVSGVGE